MNLYDIVINITEMFATQKTLSHYIDCIINSESQIDDGKAGHLPSSYGFANIFPS